MLLDPELIIWIHTHRHNICLLHMGYTDTLSPSQLRFSTVTADWSSWCWRNKEIFNSHFILLVSVDVRMENSTSSRSSGGTEIPLSKMYKNPHTVPATTTTLVLIFVLFLSFQGEYIFSLKDLQYHIFAGVVRERFSHLYWEEDLLGVLHCLVNYSPSTLWVQIRTQSLFFTNR